ncbi:MAG: gene transfer agent family protein [Pseudomonadota bacterium]
MANAYRGEVEITLNGEAQVMRLTFGALVALEEAVGPVLALVERLEAGQATAKDILSVIFAGLRGAGWTGDLSDLRQAEFGGGYLAAIQVAGDLLRKGFGIDDRNT